MAPISTGDALFDDDHQIYPADWDLPPAIRNRLGHTVGRQRVMHEGDHLLVILHRVPETDAEERRGCIAWREPGGRWRAVDGREGRIAVRETIDEYGKTLARLDDRIEARPDIEGCFEILERLAPVARAARHLHDTLQRAREAVPHERVLIDLRDQAYAIERRAELMTGDARFALDRALARSSHDHTVASARTAEAGDRLNRLAALFLPVGTAAALLGMNVQTGLEGLPPPLPFWTIVIVGLAVGLLLRYFVDRRA